MSGNVSYNVLVGWKNARFFKMELEFMLLFLSNGSFALPLIEVLPPSAFNNKIF